jgi:hypothetical protein
MLQPPPCRYRGTQLVPGENGAVERLTGSAAKAIHQLGCHPEVALPAGPIPRSSGGDQRKESSALLGCEQVQRAAHRPGLDQATLGEGAADLAGP